MLARAEAYEPRPAPPDAPPPPSVIPQSYRPTAKRLGIDVYRVEADAGTAGRARALEWVEGLVTSSGKPRSERVQRCGTLHVARCGDVYGLDHHWCRDRACPTCMRHKQRKEAAQVRRYFEEREADGGRFIFATFTQPKRVHAEERAGESLDRLLGSFRRLTNVKYASGREFKSYFLGGLRACETVWSARGTKTKDNTVVAFDGWHSHIHAILEVRPPHPADVERYGEEQAWQRRIQVASDRAVGMWLEVCAGASGQSQKMVECDVHRVGQITKYLTKPFELRANEARELFLAMKGRRVIEGFGEWRQWRQVELPEDPRPPVELGGETFQELVDKAENGGFVHFDIECIGDNAKSFHVGESIPAAFILRCIREDPRTFTQRRQDERKLLEKKRAFVEECEQVHQIADDFEDEQSEPTMAELKARLARMRESMKRREVLDAALATPELPW